MQRFNKEDRAYLLMNIRTGAAENAGVNSIHWVG